MSAPRGRGSRLGETKTVGDVTWVWLGPEMGWVKRGSGKDPDWGMGPMRIIDPADLVGQDLSEHTDD